MNTLLVYIHVLKTWRCFNIKRLQFHLQKYEILCSIDSLTHTQSHGVSAYFQDKVNLKCALYKNQSLAQLRLLYRGDEQRQGDQTNPFISYFWCLYLSIF